MKTDELKTAIRTALAGSSSQQPVEMRELLKLGKGAGDILAKMEDLGEINSASVYRDGSSKMLVWLTGFGVPPLQLLRVPATPKPKKPAKVKPVPTKLPVGASRTRDQHAGAAHEPSALALRIVFDENEYIRIFNDGQEITLDLTEAARVARFIGRVQGVVEI